MYFDQKLNFKTHIAIIKSKISKSLFALRQVKNILSDSALLSLYFSTVHCHLVYGIQIWGSASQSTLNELFKKQKNAIRLITKSKYNSHTEPLFKKLQVLPLTSLIKYFNLQFMHNFNHNSESKTTSTCPDRELVKLQDYLGLNFRYCGISLVMMKLSSFRRSLPLILY